MKLSINAKMYRNTGTYAVPVWVLMNNVGDLTLSDSYDEANVTRRASGGFSETEPTLRNVELSFSTFNIASDDDFTALLAAFTGRSSIDIAVLDGLVATSGTRGVRAHFKVTSFNRNQNLADVQGFDVTMKPCHAANAPVDMSI